MSGCVKIKTIVLAICLLGVLSTFGRQPYLVCNDYMSPYKAYLHNYPTADSLTVDSILQSGRLVSSYPAFEVVSFTISTVGLCMGGNGVVLVHCDSNNFSDKARYVVKLLRPGNFLFFECIRVKNKAGSYFLLHPFVIKIVASHPSNAIHPSTALRISN